MELYTWSKPNKSENSIPIKSKLNTGVTFIIGPNGSGKTTYLNQLASIFKNKNVSRWESIEENNKIENEYSSFYYNNVTEEKFAKQNWLDRGDSFLFAASFENSEGQDMYDFLIDKVSDIGACVKKAKDSNKKGIFILLDGLDSGLSIDVLNKLKVELFDFIIQEELKDNFEVYILVSANSYEMVEGNYDCLDIRNMNIVRFKSYDDYKNYYLNNMEVNNNESND